MASGPCQSTLAPEDGMIRLRILLDRTSIEVFGNDGRLYMPLCLIPPDWNRSLAAYCANGEVKVHSLRVYELKSAW